MKTCGKYWITSLAVATRTLTFGTVAGVLLMGSAILAAQEATPQPPGAIAPIEAPFAMPQLERPTFADRTFDIRDYGAVPCPWGSADKRKSTAAIQKAIDFEARGEKFYEELAEACENPQEQQFFEFLSEIEREHRLSLVDTLAYLQDPQAWLEQHERITLDGA